MVAPQVAPVDPWLALSPAGQRGDVIAAPVLWRAEAVSTVRAHVYAGQLTEAQGTAAVEQLTLLSIDLVDLDPDLCRSAYAWAGRLRQRRAYDGFYLALADRLGIPFWTGDRRLFNACRVLGLTWVEWAGP